MSAMPKTGNEQKTVKPKVRALLNKFGWFWWATPMNGFGRTGISDTCALQYGVFLAIESKFGSRKCTAQQIGFLNTIASQPAAFGLVVTEKTLEAFEVFLSNFGKATQLTADRISVPADIGAPMLDAIKALTDYPKTMEEFTKWRDEPTTGRTYNDELEQDD